ncbi:hypothetical protein E2C01_008139 [Portunus trituberculatus]|uniref:Uncharacterized protein n=1 Tax=Portunus trituberculatus TaxID=210409 RepID=A0A5B7D2A8_PORTR|nr:hypothetical protein [Portunus trituberculatus]
MITLTVGKQFVSQHKDWDLDHWQDILKQPVQPSFVQPVTNYFAEQPQPDFQHITTQPLHTNQPQHIITQPSHTNQPQHITTQPPHTILITHNQHQHMSPSITTTTSGCLTSPYFFSSMRTL